MATLQVGCRVRVTPNCRAARLAGRTGAVVGLGRQVELKLDGDDHQLSKVNRNEAAAAALTAHSAAGLPAYGSRTAACAPSPPEAQGGWHGEQPAHPGPRLPPPALREA